MEPERSMRSATAELADYLERVLEGTASLEALLNSPGSFASVLEPCVGGLYHFIADKDIRDKDAEYRTMQERSMQKLIELLRSGAPSERLAKVSFLGGTGS